MKIGIIGKGLSGILTALIWKAQHPNVELELFYDKSIPTEPVGSGSWPNLLQLLNDISYRCPQYTSDWNDSLWQSTPKVAIRYEGWGKKDSWAHGFGYNNTAMHFDPQEFQDYFCNSGIFNVTEKHVEYDDIDADYIYDCAGYPKDYNDCYTLKNPINKVLLANLPPSFDENSIFTRTVATPDGWCFVIPLKDRVSLGYLYNDLITTDEEAEDNFKEQFGVTNIFNKISFKNYCAKNPVIDDRIFLNGNKYFFIEPLEATAIYSYMNWISRSIAAIYQRIPFKEIVNINQKLVKDNADFILKHYSYGSKYNTPFWNYAKRLGVDNSDLDDIIMRSEDEDWFNLIEENFAYYKGESVLQMHYNMIGDDYNSLRLSKWS